jgi:rhodanese-related sulfurtransferase
VLVTGSGSTSELRDLTDQLWRVGIDRPLGHLDGGLDAWEGSGRRLVGHDLLTSDELADELVAGLTPSILDVRQPTEWREGTLARSRTIFVGDLSGRLGLLPRDRTWTVICRSGMRAGIAASLLERGGHRVRVVVEGGVPDVLARLGSGAPRSLALVSRA